MASVQQQQAAHITSVVEEKTFRIRLEEGEPLIKSAIEEAAGVRLEELAEGMWFGSRQDGRWVTIEVTARALPIDRGTTVELRVEHKTNPIATTLMVFGAIAGAMLILPLIAIIAYGQKAGQAQQRQRLVTMHRMWREIAAAVGAPRRAGYREAPARAYPRRQKDRIEVDRIEDEPLEEQEGLLDEEEEDEERSA
jgi:hypothetical protein